MNNFLLYARFFDNDVEERRKRLCGSQPADFSFLGKILLGTMDVGKKFASPPFKYLSSNFSFNQSGGLITKVFHFRKYLNLIFHQKWDENIKIRAAPIKLKLGVH